MLLDHENKFISDEEALRLFNLLKASAKLTGQVVSMLEKGYNGIYPTRRDLMIECNKVRDTIEELEKAGDIITRRKK